MTVAQTDCLFFSTFMSNPTLAAVSSLSPLFLLSQADYTIRTVVSVTPTNTCLATPLFLP